MNKTLPAHVLDAMLLERTAERDLARDVAVALEAEVATLRQDVLELRERLIDVVARASVIAGLDDHNCDTRSRAVGVLLRLDGADWTSGVPRSVPDDLDEFRCACGRPGLAEVTHSAAICSGHEQDGVAQ